MVRTHIVPCALPREGANALDRERGRIYTDVLVSHSRVYRRTGHWLTPGDAGEGKRLTAKAQQKLSGWSRGRQVAYLTSELQTEGIALARQSDAYRSKPCPECGALTAEPTGGAIAASRAGLRAAATAPVMAGM